MSKSHTEQVQPLFTRNNGVTVSERYLQRLCDKSFLSLWSYSGLYRDQGQRGGKEICDLLVLFDNHVLIFSDKDCEFPKTQTIDVDWARWYKKAIEDSAKQVWGAERWIRQYPHRVFLDRACKQPFPLPFPDTKSMIVHRIVVANGAAQRCKEFFNNSGSGSLMLDTSIHGVAHYTPDADHYRPFVVGLINPDRGFVHVFDEITLPIILDTLDTISDFVAYLEKKEQFLQTRNVCVAGEEELLAFYLQHKNKNGEHDFVIKKKFAGIYIDEGFWDEFCASEERCSQQQANEISYAWDELIDKFSYHAVTNTQYHRTHSSLSDTERILRFMAREPRTRRRMLASALLGMIFTTPRHLRRTRVLLPSHSGDAHFVFLLFPHSYSKTEEQYRSVRMKFLEMCCMVTKLRFPSALDIIGIATDSGDDEYRSEDAMYFDARDWTEQAQHDAIEIQKELGILLNPPMFVGTELEYPSEVKKLNSSNQKRSKFMMKGKNRNEPCICGSGKKFKRCCGVSGKMIRID